MFQDKQWLQDFEALPPEKQAEVVDFIHFLQSRQTRQIQAQKRQRPFGILRGEVWMSDDFDAPLEDFSAYM